MNPVFPPIRIDLFAIFILLGFVQGLILAYFSSLIGKAKSRRIFSWILMLWMSLIMLYVWLGYTNYMSQMLWLVGFTEPVNLILAPMSYLYFKAGISNRSRKGDWLHTIPFFIYLVYMCLMIYCRARPLNSIRTRQLFIRKCRAFRIFAMVKNAQMVGYNSKSAFNTAFRKITGLTPPNGDHLPGVPIDKPGNALGLKFAYLCVATF